jgi:hypothetical protein
MAHSCPDCGEACYCGTDIDDCLFDNEDDVIACTHCLYEDSREDDCDDTYSPDDDSWAGGFAENH